LHTVGQTAVEQKLGFIRVYVERKGLAVLPMQGLPLTVLKIRSQESDARELGQMQPKTGVRRS
jgi:hypothetical protein